MKQQVDSKIIMEFHNHNQHYQIVSNQLTRNKSVVGFRRENLGVLQNWSGHITVAAGSIIYDYSILIRTQLRRGDSVSQISTNFSYEMSCVSLF